MSGAPLSSLDLIRDCLLELAPPQGDGASAAANERRELAWCDLRIERGRLRVELALSEEMAQRLHDFLEARCRDAIEYLRTEPLPDSGLVRFSTAMRHR